jgi:hypothetical protein
MKTNHLFILIVLSSIILSYCSKLLLKTDVITIKTLAEQLTNKQINEMIAFQKKWQWLEYIITPLLLVVKISLVAVILDLGCFIFDKKIKYKQLLNIAVKAEFILLSVIVFKTIWFYVFQQEYTLEDLQYFYPLSALNIIGYEGLEPWYIYPLQVLNLFELVYWLIIAYLLGKALKISTDKGLGIVASSYGIGLIIWVVGVMFLTLNIN